MVAQFSTGILAHFSISIYRYVHIADTFKSNIKSPLDDLLMEEDEV